MATPEQIAAKVQATMANTTTTMTAAAEASPSRMLEGLTSRIAANINTGGGTSGNGGFGPSGKIFRDIGKFGGEEGAWAEWKFRTTVKEYDVGLFQALEMAGDSEVEINMTEVAQSNIMDRCMEKSAMLYNRFVHLVSGAALTLHPSVVGENGLEVWRLLKKRYDPKTTLRNLQLWLKIMNSKKVKKSQDFPAQVNRWEGWVNMLKRDCGQEVAETARVGLLILMAPDELQGIVLEHADRLREYRQIKEKNGDVARRAWPAEGSQRNGHRLLWRGGLDMLPLWCDGAHCKRVPDSERKGERKRGQKLLCEWDEGSRERKGKSAGGEGRDKGKGKGSMVYAHCGNRGHDTSRCWTLHPEQLP